MNDSARTFVLVGLVVVILLALHLMPTLHIKDTELRTVNILSDILPEHIRERDAIDHIPTLPAEAEAEADSVDEAEQHSPMQHFYQQLYHINELGLPLRIAYFGDSFIEGDILSCDLREQLQTRFGGCGVGWVDCGSQIATFRQTVRHSFNGLEEYEVVKRPFNKQVESIAQRYFTVKEQAWFHYRGVTARQHLDAWDTSTFFFRTSGGFTLATSINGDSAIAEYVTPADHLQTLKQHRHTRSIRYSVSDLTPDTYLYGVALEGHRGIVVDNLSMRGSSGVSLGELPEHVLREFAAVRPYDLIIIHFGLNVANEKSHAANYKAYTRQMGEAIEHLREAFPEASFLVVSMPDRDQRTAAGIRTMLGVESLVAYQQIMAAEHHVAFFNLFQAMGGRESMKALVDQGLANKDYTHLTFGGGRRLGTLLTDYLTEGFENFKRTQP